MSLPLRILRRSLLIVAAALAAWMPASVADARCAEYQIESYTIYGPNTCISTVCYNTGEGIGPFTRNSYCFYDDCWMYVEYCVTG